MGTVLVVGRNGRPVLVGGTPTMGLADDELGVVLPTGTAGAATVFEAPVYKRVSTIGPEGSPDVGAIFLNTPEANLSTAENALPKAPLYSSASKGMQPPFLQTPRLRRRSVEQRTPSRSVDKMIEGNSKKLILTHR